MWHRPNYGAELKIIGALLEQPVIEKLLMHLDLQARAPSCSPARGQTLLAARRRPTVTDQVTQPSEPLELAAWKGLQDKRKRSGDQG
jgi:hypothetical protein